MLLKQRQAFPWNFIKKTQREWMPQLMGNLPFVKTGTRLR